MRFVILIGTFLLACNCIAQEPYFRNYSVQQGLPSSEAYDIMQDRSGFIWISTDRGVSRYDGYSFRNFSTADGLTDNTVFVLNEDFAGRIWCVTLNSKLCYFEDGEHIVPYKFNSSLQESSGQTSVIRSLAVTENDDVIVGRQLAGCMKIDAEGKRTDLSSPVTDSIIVSELYSTPGYFVFGSTDQRPRNFLEVLPQQMFVSDSGKQRFTMGLQPAIPTYYVTALRKKDGTILLSTGNMLLEVLPDGTRKMHTFDAVVIRISEDAAGNIWIGMSGKGVRCFAPGSELSGSDYISFLTNETVTDILQDAEGGYWMSTLDHGIFFLASINVHCLSFGAGNGSVAVTALADDGAGHMVAGTSGGSICYFGKTRMVHQLDCAGGVSPSAFVQDITVSPAGGSMVVCTNHAIVLVDSGKITERFDRQGFGRSVTYDNEGGFWIGGMGGLRYFNPSSERTEEKKRTSSSWIQEVYFDAVTGKLLVGALDGLFWWTGDSLTPYVVAGKTVSDRVSSIVRTGDMLVAGTIGNGVCIITGDTIISVGEKQGLCSSMINDLSVDARGNIWAATNAGVAQIKCVQGKPEVNCFTVYHGLPTDEVTRVCCRKDTVWVGTTNGPAWFVPAEITSAPVSPPIYIQEINAGGQLVPDGSLTDFSYDRNHIRFSFLGISYRNNGTTLYRYRLKGLDTAWTYTSNRSVEFASLSPGDYSFEVMARNGDGIWSDIPAIYSFSIDHPFWATWWFWVLVVTFTGSGVAWLIFQRIRRVRNRARQRAVLAEYQHQALAAQMNPHFIFNSLTSMQAFILGNEKENALRYIDRFSFLIRKSLEHSMLRFVSLEKEAELLRAYFDLEAMRFDHQFTWNVSFSEEINMRSLEVPAMLIQPFAENAIRHGVMHRDSPGGHVEVSFGWSNGRLSCTIEDNGVGRKRSAEINRSRRRHVSFGSSITEERLRLLCEVMDQEFNLIYTDKSNDDGSPAGTTIFFLLPSRNKERHD